MHLHLSCTSMYVCNSPLPSKSPLHIFYFIFPSCQYCPMHPSIPGPPPHSQACHPSPSTWRESRSSQVLQKDAGAGSHLQAGFAQPGGTETREAGTSRAGGGHSTVRYACIECVIFFVRGSVLVFKHQLSSLGVPKLHTYIRLW